jgi:hypothetical protein
VHCLKVALLAVTAFQLVLCGNGSHQFYCYGGILPHLARHHVHEQRWKKNYCRRMKKER